MRRLKTLVALITVIGLSLAVPTAATAQVISASSSPVNIPAPPTPPTEVGVGSLAPDVLGVQASPEVLGETASNGLAVTGSDIAGLALMGAVSIGAGGLVLAARRRRMADSSVL